MSFQPHLTLQRALDVLSAHDLLSASPAAPAEEAEVADVTFTHLTYASGEVSGPDTLLICKGAFKDAYMRDAASRGLAYYVADRTFSSDYAHDARVILVKDTRKTLAVLAQEFYGHPDKELTTIGITGTKGKSTTAYYTHAIVNDYFTHKAALISSVDNCTDGVTYVESDLTTPESLDLYRMLREAVNNGLTHAVIEVSSQAYKVDRVYNLHFSIGAFLNIFPDHISPIEHPTFDDYFACKRQIIAHSDVMVFGADILHRDVLDEDVRTAGIDAYFVGAAGIAHTDIALDMPGQFNYANAAVAVKLAELAGVPADSSSILAVNHVRISGRMEVFRGTHENDSQVLAIVDYAHNGISTTTLLDYVDSEYGAQHPHITLVTGSAGNKAYNRRPEIVHAAENRIHRFIFTTEDTNTESEEHICRDMDNAITNPDVQHDIIIDRTEAVETALKDAAALNSFAIVLVIGKGNERWIKHLNHHVAYEGDDAIVKRILL
ncbi:UDP-N-acetylmuramoyl-L-alanyl-D-glutamate--2,6-diaminopimelate ligase [Alloscardovia macacae]|uniref:UDP-N-acetylmuramoylalanyl-D-glutamate--2, 6-diaminopimelate ligase n=1 Tax=Alloscardovia macacae TaxID=1160091 RepID=A0A261F1X1_9BIFI|nr:UDP-N-acetylmuramoyl-L-alanyl-D-glutamate--2,6-diaminopimelate ligase [Alloscardovia macacae]OZG53065.1 UDP-N-acetylmuramoylalanyl-D-glutamate--2, 6-diaminopimelate ligase [Alloscardovia macacae]